MNITTEQAVQLIKQNANKQPVTRSPMEQQYQVPDELKKVAAYVFRQLTSMKTGWRVAFTDERQVKDYKIQLLRAMDENGINNFELVEAGLKQCRSDTSDFLPSPGKFVAWCKPTITGELNAGMYKEYRPERLISNKTFEERRAEAKSELAKIKEMLCKSKT
jgi:hypothetical protein